MAKGTGKKMMGGGKTPGTASVNGSQKPMKKGVSRAVGGVSSSGNKAKW